MTEASESVALITIMVRRDAHFPNEVFISLRRYDLVADEPPVDHREVVSIADAVDLTARWLTLCLGG
jgi:hypothetical protein